MASTFSKPFEAVMIIEGATSKQYSYFYTLEEAEAYNKEYGDSVIKGIGGARNIVIKRLSMQE